jgi:hypothetical protein
VASTCIFYDVTQGDMDVNCTGRDNCYLPSGTNGVLSTLDSSYSPSYGATTGWDFATGIGSVNAANLVNNWPVSASGPPLAPTFTSAAPISAGEIDLAWTNPAGSSATGNSVLRCTGMNCTPTNAIASLPPTSTTYQDKSVSPSTTYTYLIQATGTGSPANSNPLTATTLAPPAPAPPTLTVGFATRTSLTLLWTETSTSTTVFNILRCQGVGCTPSMIIATRVGTARAYRDTGLMRHTTYRYQVKASNTGGSALSNTAQGTTN